jgi:hypothetical protein
VSALPSQTVRSALRQSWGQPEGGPPALDFAPGSRVSQPYRLLALDVVTSLHGADYKTLAMFAPDSRIPSSRVSLNLALALAQQANVLLITSSLAADTTTDPPSSRLIVHSERFVPARFRELSNGTRYVLVDAPAADTSSAAYYAAQEARNALYLLPTDATELDPHIRNIRQLHRLKVRVLGVVRVNA